MKSLRKTFAVGTLMLLVGLAGAEVFTDSSSVNFNKGEYSDTLYNLTAGFVHLNFSAQGNGSYSSQIFDAGSVVEWYNMSWISGVGYQQELPDSKATESGLGGANMSRNVLLLHLNNDADYDEDSSTAYDFSGTGNNGTWVGTAGATTIGKFGKAANIPGDNNNYLRIADDWTLDITTALSMEFWVYFDAITTSDALIYKDKAYRARLPGFNSDRIECSFYRSGWKNVRSSNAAIQTGKWHHVVCTIDPSETEQMYVYVDGRLVGSESGVFGSGNISFSSDDLHIGCNHNGGSCFNGRLDEVAIYNRLLSEEEVSDHYKRGVLDLQASVRSCDDASCSGESFSGISSESPSDLSVNKNRYFQYQFDFETIDSDFTPELHEATLSYADTYSPSSVTSLADASKTDSSITWSWSNPSDSDFSENIIYIDGMNEINTSAETYNATGLLPEASYTINIHTVDTSGNVNDADVSSSVETLPTPDLTPPSSVTDLVNQSRTNDSIYWVWDNPNDSDFEEVIIYIDGNNTFNTTSQAYNLTNLTADTEYTILIHTVDEEGNINDTDVSNTTSTLANIVEEAGDGGSSSSSGSSSSGGSSSSSGGSGGGGSSGCVPSWDCTESECQPDGTKVVSCTDTRRCGVFKPDEIETCVVEGDEEGTDNLFDVGLELTTEETADKIVAAVTLINFGGEGVTDVKVKYIIRNMMGDIVIEESEIVPVETQVEYTKEFDLSGYEEGQYSLYTALEYEDQTEPAESEQIFTVTSASVTDVSNLRIRVIPIGLFIVLLVSSGIFISKLVGSRSGKPKRKVRARKEKTAVHKVKKKHHAKYMKDKKSSANFFNLNAITDKGHELGTVRDLEFALNSGEIVNVVVKNPTDYLLTKKKVEIPKRMRDRRDIVLPFSAVISAGDFLILSEKEIE